MTIVITKAQIEKTTTLKADKIDNTGAIKRKRWNGLAPAQYNIGNITLSITTEVPKSGWFKTINTGRRAIVMGKIIDLKFCILMPWSDKYLARAITKDILASSLGWKLKGKPILSHLYVPAWEFPKNGSITKIEPIP